MHSYEEPSAFRGVMVALVIQTFLGMLGWFGWLIVKGVL